MSSLKRSIVVTRTYEHQSDYCTEAHMLILKKSVNQKADKPAPELVGRDGTPVQGDDSANAIVPH